MPDLERLVRFVTDAPDGTMVPVESLRAMLENVEAATADDGERLLTAAEAAEWLHRHVGGRKRSAAAVRKVMRTGYRGVVLASSTYGRERRTTQADLLRFIAEIGVVPRPPAQTAAAELPSPAAAPAGGHGDPADEIAAAQDRFRQRRPAPSTVIEKRRAAGGA